MRRMFLSLVLASFFIGNVAAQVRGVKAGSAEAQQKKDDFRARMDASAPAGSGLVRVADLTRVGAKGKPDMIAAKVIQVIDEGRMLVGVADARTNDGSYSTLIMLKATTKGIVDGTVCDWDKIIGQSGQLHVTDTVQYRTALGSTKTVPLVEALWNNNPKDKKAAAPAEGVGRRGPSIPKSARPAGERNRPGRIQKNQPTRGKVIPERTQKEQKSQQETPATAENQEEKESKQKAKLAQQRQEFAATLLKRGNELVAQENPKEGRRFLERVVKDYSETTSAKEAEKILKKLKP